MANVYEIHKEDLTLLKKVIINIDKQNGNRKLYEEVFKDKNNNNNKYEVTLDNLFTIILEENKVQFSTSKRTAVQKAVKTGSGRQWYQRKIICRCG